MNWAAFSHNALRIVMGLLFLPHGLQKVFGILGRPQATDALHWVAGFIEVIGGILILIGFQTRWTAFICSGTMAVAYFMVHQPQGLLPIVNMGELALIYSFVFLFLWGNGGGSWSLDAKLGKK